MGDNHEDEDDFMEDDVEDDDEYGAPKARRRKGASAAAASSSSSSQTATQKRNRVTRDTEVEAEASNPDDIAGTIMSVELENFMCHRNFEVKFTKGLNCVSGNNGSGKSSILVALTICLGGSARKSHRADSNKNLVGIHGDKAKITIQLSNRGLNPYKRQVFGDSIYVVRTLSKTGGGSYQLLKHDRKAAPGYNKGVEIKKLTDHFCIFVENPCCILMQDMAKQFLTQSDDGKSHYEYFFQSTQLHRLRDELRSANEYLTNATQIHEARKQQAVEFETNQLLPAKIKYDEAVSLRNLSVQKQHMLHELAWAKVDAADKILHKLMDLRVNEERKLGEAQKLLEASKKKMDDYEKESQSKGDEVDEILSKIQEQQQQLDAAKDKVKAAHRDFSAAERAVKMKEAAAKHASATLEAAKGEYRRVQSEARTKATSSRTDLKQLLQDKNDEMNELKRNWEAAKRDIKIGEPEKERLTQALDKVKNDHQMMQKAFNHKNKILRDAKASREDAANIFGQYTRRIQDMIKTKRFSRPPLGPIGSLLGLQDMHWAKPAEIVLKDVRSSYLVATREDRQALFDIFNALHIPARDRPTVNLMQFRGSMNFESSPMSPGTPTVLSILDVKLSDSDERNWVLNFLCVQADVEKINLKDDLRAAFKEVHNKNAISYSHEGVYVEDKRGDTGQFGAPRGAIAPIFTSCSFDIPALEREVRDLQGQYDELSQQVKALSKDLQTVETNLSRARATEHKSQSEFNRLQRVIANLNEDIKEMNSQNEVEQNEFKPFEDAVAQAQDEVAAAKDAIEEAKKELEPRRNIVKECEKERESFEAKIREYQKTIDKMQDALAKQQSRADKLRRDMLQAEREVAVADKRVADAAERIVTQQNKVEDERKLAIEVHAEELHPDKSPEELTEEIAGITKKIQSEERNRGQSMQEIEEEYARMSARAQKNRSQLAESTAMVTQLKTSMEKRKASFKKSRLLLATVVSSQFNALMQWKGASGSITFDHQNSKASFSVTPSAATSSATSRIAMLSGGESSFTTLCYGLAISYFLEAPFRCLDEFDVFMDEANRRLSLELLTDVLNVIPVKKQYILLTPTSLASFTGMNKIYLKPAERNVQGRSAHTEEEEQQEQEEEQP